MRLEIIISETSSDKRLSKPPAKDGDTVYACGLTLLGSWASRLQQHREFIDTPIGRYILEFEKDIITISEAADKIFEVHSEQRLSSVIELGVIKSICEKYV